MYAYTHTHTQNKKEKKRKEKYWMMDCLTCQQSVYGRFLLWRRRERIAQHYKEENGTLSMWYYEYVNNIS